MRTSSSGKIYRITEYGGFVNKESAANGAFKYLPEDAFNKLEMLILGSRVGSDRDAAQFMALSARRGGIKKITARNYVGVISMADGTAIEILPKICNLRNDENGNQAKTVLIEMLRALSDLPFKHFQESSLQTDRLGIFEIFIKMFADEVTAVTKQGLKSAYVTVEANERFFRGRLNMALDIRHNAADQARFFVRYSVFNLDRAENRLIKATIRFLLKLTGDARNRRLLARLLSQFEAVGETADIDADFSRCASNQSMSHYERALSWCGIFLKRNSFTPNAGNDRAMALLFSMERVFERYIAEKARKHKPAGWEIHTQDRRHTLFDDPKAFGLCPDIVLENARQVVLIDTKWKLPRKAKDISRADMYQMYAYGKRYAAIKNCAARVILLYPKPDEGDCPQQTFKSDDDVMVEVRFIDLTDTDSGIKALLGEICSG